MGQPKAERGEGVSPHLLLPNWWQHQLKCGGGVYGAPT